MFCAKGRVAQFNSTKVYSTADISSFDLQQVSDSIDVIIHLAALVHQPDQRDINQYMRVNCDATLTLAKKALQCGVKKFIFMSTCSVYDGFTGLLSENADVKPVSPYGVSKFEASKGLLKLFSNSTSRIYILRPNLIYGQGGKGNYRLLSSLISRLAFTPFRNALMLRSYISVNNLCGFIHYLIQNNIESGIYNVSDNHDLSTRELCELIAEAQNKRIIQLAVPNKIMKSLFSVIGKKDHFDKIYCEFRLNIDKALATGWKPKPIDSKDFVI